MQRVILSIGSVLVMGASVLLAGNGTVTVVSDASTSVSFAKPIRITSPVLYPYSLAAGDLDHDGIPDLAVVSADNTANLTYALGKGNGHFGRWHRDQDIYTPIFVLFADADGDGNLDAVTMYPLTVAFGDGKGGFDANLQLNTGQGFAVRAVVLDLNGDGIPDIVGSYQDDGGGQGGIFTLLGKGNRNFGNPTNISSGGFNPVGVAVGDLNHDGIPDLVVANWGQDAGPYGNLAVLLGRGDGTFDKPVTYYAGIHPTELVLADLNGDGNLDVSVTSNLGVRVFLGKGDGTLSPPKVYHPGKYPNSIVSADFNGDGIPDLAVTNYTNPKPCHVSIMLGNGDGTFQLPVQFRVGISPAQLVVADFNHDGKPDIATINGGSSTISILLNTTQFPVPPHAH